MGASHQTLTTRSTSHEVMYATDQGGMARFEAICMPWSRVVYSGVKWHKTLPWPPRRVVAADPIIHDHCQQRSSFHIRGREQFAIGRRTNGLNNYQKALFMRSSLHAIRGSPSSLSSRLIVTPEEQWLTASRQHGLPHAPLLFRQGNGDVERRSRASVYGVKDNHGGVIVKRVLQGTRVPTDERCVQLQCDTVSQHTRHLHGLFAGARVAVHA